MWLDEIGDTQAATVQGLHRIALFTNEVQSQFITHTWKVPVQFPGRTTAASEDVGFNASLKDKTHCSLLCSSRGKLKKWNAVIRAPTEMNGKAPSDTSNTNKKIIQSCWCVPPFFFFLYTSKIAIGSRKKTQLKDRLFLLRPNFLPLTVGRNFSYTSLSRGFIWSSPIVRKTPQPLQQTSWVRQVSQSTGSCCFRMVFYPRKQDAKFTLAFHS